MNPNLKASPTIWLMGIVTTVVGTTLAVEARYAKAGDVSSAKEELKREIASQRSYTEDGFMRQRKAQLEDKVFELEAKHQSRKINEIELRQLFRYRAELEDINQELRTKRKGK